MSEPSDVIDGEVVEVTTLDIVRAQDMAALDVQVSTAKAYPRSVQKFQSDLETWATMSEGVAKNCFFVKPVGGGNIVGPSVRFAELVQASYTNMVTDARVLEVGKERIMAEGTCRDLERNIAGRAQVSRSILGRDGRRYKQSVIETNIAASLAIARRNAIFQVVPRAIWEGIYEKARHVAAGGESFIERRNEIGKALVEAGCDRDQMFAYFGGRGGKDLTADDVIAMSIKLDSIKNGMLKAEDAFPAKADKTDEEPAAADALDSLKKDKPGKKKQSSDEPTGNPALDEEPPADWEAPE